MIYVCIHVDVCACVHFCLCLATTSGQRSGMRKTISTTRSERAKQGLGAKGRKMSVHVCAYMHVHLPACMHACVCMYRRIRIICP